MGLNTTCWDPYGFLVSVDITSTIICGLERPIFTFRPGEREIILTFALIILGRASEYFFSVIVPVIDNIFSKKKKTVSCFLRDAPYPVKYKSSHIRQYQY